MHWNTISSIAAAASAVFAGWQILQSRRDSRLRATFEQLGQIELRVQAVRHVAPSELCAKARDAYRSGGLWDDDCRAYLALLDGLELLAMARRLKTVERSTVDEFLRPIVRRELVSLSALADFRTAWNEASIYDELGKLLVTYESARRTLPKRTMP